MAAPEPGQAGWAVELLPVYLEVDGRINWLCRTGQDAWRALGRPDASPPDVLLEPLAIFGCGPFVAHSTSWRFDAEAGLLVLSYLVLLPTLHPGAIPDRFEVAPVERADLARGDLAAPPPRIGMGQVLEHALRHLAWLAGDDPTIRALLGPAWVAALGPYSPEPFRSIQEVFVAAPGVAAG